MTEIAWSYSRLNAYEVCPKRSFHYNIAKDVVEPESPQLRDGSALHKAFENRVKFGTSLPLGMGHHEKLLSRIVDAPGETHAEQKLALTKEFEPSSFFGPRVWFRIVLDAAKINDDYAVVFDYKTGKPSYDTTQLQLCAATMFHHMPALTKVRAAYLFVNHDVTVKEDYHRSDLTDIWAGILPRVRKFEAAVRNQFFPPKPGGLCAKYCSVTSCNYNPGYV